MTRTFASEMEAILEKFAKGARLDKSRGKAVHELTEEALKEYERLKEEKEKIQPFLE